MDSFQCIRLSFELDDDLVLELLVNAVLYGALGSMHSFAFLCLLFLLSLILLYPFVICFREREIVLVERLVGIGETGWKDNALVWIDFESASVASDAVLLQDGINRRRAVVAQLEGLDTSKELRSRDLKEFRSICNLGEN